MTFKIAHVGCGQMSVLNHGPAQALYQATHPGTALVACCDVAPDKARNFASLFGYARHYTDLARMLDEEAPDCACLVVPEEATCPVGCQILERGVPLLLEKPPGRMLTENARLIAAARVRDTPHQVAFNRRYAPLMQALRTRVTEALGDDPIQAIHYELTRVNRDFPLARYSTTAIHAVDAVRFLAGCDYAHVRFHYSKVPGARHAHNIFMDCEMTTGATARVSVLPHTGVNVERARVHASQHAFFLHNPVWHNFDAPGELLHITRNEVAYRATARDFQVGEDLDDFELNGVYATDAAFFEAIRHGQRPAGTLEAARQSVAVAECIAEQRAEFKASDVPPLEPGKGKTRGPAPGAGAGAGGGS